MLRAPDPGGLCVGAAGPGRGGRAERAGEAERGFQVLRSPRPPAAGAAAAAHWAARGGGAADRWAAGAGGGGVPAAASAAGGTAVPGGPPEPDRWAHPNRMLETAGNQKLLKIRCIDPNVEVTSQALSFIGGDKILNNICFLWATDVRHT